MIASFRLEFEPVQDDFQHDFARMADEADGSALLAGLDFLFLSSPIEISTSNTPWLLQIIKNCLSDVCRKQLTSYI